MAILKFRPDPDCTNCGGTGVFAEANPETGTPEEDCAFCVEEWFEQRAIIALHATWQAIAPDAFSTLEDDDGRPLTRMSQAEVIDLVTSCGFSTGHPAAYGNDKEAVEWLEEQDEATQDRICKLAFPHRWYS